MTLKSLGPAPVPARTQEFRDQYRSKLPPGFDGWRQQRRVTGAMAVVAALLLAGLQELSWSLLATAVGTWVLATAGEYVAHRVAMHRPLPLLEFMFRRHVRVHHRYFTDRAITGSDPLDVHATVLAPVQLGAILVLGVLPMGGLTLLLSGADQARVVGVTVLAYLCFFEWVHLACHLPKDHFAMRIPGISWAREHHRLHHDPKRMTRFNFQISNPAVDYLTRTVALASPLSLVRAEDQEDALGPCVSCSGSDRPASPSASAGPRAAQQ